METGQHDLYMLTTSDPVEFTSADLAACVGLIGGGGAVNPASSERELPLATYVTVVRAEGQVVGVGAIKRIRPDYTSKVAVRSGAPIDPGTPELGYVSVSAEHQGHRLSARAVAELVARASGRLFATTDNERMKSTLRKTGFAQIGRGWQGERGELSLWFRVVKEGQG